MKRALYFLIVAMLAAPFASVMADTEIEGEVSAMGIVVDMLLLGAGALCFATCMKIFGLLKGGELSGGWQLLSVSFLVFCFAQLLSISSELELFGLHRNVVSLLQLVALTLTVMGVTRIKKSLT